MDVILAQLALFFVPGVIWASVEAGFSASQRWGGAMFLARAFLFGAVANAILYAGYLIGGFSFFDLSVIEQTGIPDLASVFDEIALSVVVALVLSVFWLFAGTHRILVRLLHRIGATQRFGDASVWEFLMNADQAPVEYVHVRDLKNDLILCGWVDSFSEASDLREMLLRDAIVYDKAGKVMSETPYLYISRDQSDLWIEFPYAERESKRFSKQKVGAIKQIYAGETVKGGHNGLSLITERPDPPFIPAAAEEQKPEPPSGHAGPPSGPPPSAGPPPAPTPPSPGPMAKQGTIPGKVPPRPNKVEPPNPKGPIARKKLR